MLRVLLLAVALLTPSALQGAVAGRVESVSGTAIEHARVAVAGGAGHVFTDARGAFELPSAVPPLQLVVSHPRFEGRSVEVLAPSAPILVVLAPKQAVYEAIVVSASRGEEESFAPVSVAATRLEPGAAPAPPTTLTELVSSVPGVAQNGQGGLFQVFSIRGISRHRVLTLIDGMRLAGDRRAGVESSFLDPRLVETVDVIRGPASTYYGSGALGGVVQLFPRRFEALTLESGYEAQGDETYELVGWGREGWSLGAVRRRAEGSEAPGGRDLNSGFRQYSVTAERSWGSRRSYELGIVAAAGRDIGKSSTDFPDRRSTFYDEDHLLVRFKVSASPLWQVQAFLHPHALDTENLRPDRRETVENDSLDLGLSWQWQPRRNGKPPLRLGVDYFSRRGVDATQRTRRTEALPGAGDEILRPLDGAREEELGLYAAGEWRRGRATLFAGGRVTVVRQSNRGAQRRTTSGLNGFVGAVAPLGKGFELAANVGTGFRVPTLSERFFSGATGRGGVIGAPGLGSERALSADLGLRWYGRHMYLAGSLFRTRIEDYVERLEVAPDLFTFVNLTSGTLQGAELDGSLQVARKTFFEFGGHRIRGRGDGGGPLADVPADRLFVGLRREAGRWRLRGRWEYRAHKGDPGSGEKPIDASHLLTATVERDLQRELGLRVSVRNLLDASYFASADAKTPLSSGRSVGVGLVWNPGEPRAREAPAATR